MTGRRTSAERDENRFSEADRDVIAAAMIAEARRDRPAGHGIAAWERGQVVRVASAGWRALHLTVYDLRDSERAECLARAEAVIAAYPPL